MPKLSPLRLGSFSVSNGLIASMLLMHGAKIIETHQEDGYTIFVADWDRFDDLRAEAGNPPVPRYEITYIDSVAGTFLHKVERDWSDGER